MSGHSKWSQIKRQKASTDAAKSKIFARHALTITLESKKAGGNTAAASLASAIERAKRDNMPKENIERAVAKGTVSGGDALEKVVFETFGPGGTAIIIVAITNNNNRTAPEIRHLLTKHECSLGHPGSSMWAFTKTADGYNPVNPVDLSDDDAEKLSLLVDALESHPDVQEVYTSADTTE